MTGTEIAETLWAFGLLTGGIWGLTELLGAVWHARKELIALVIGAVIYPTLAWVGVLTMPIEGISTARAVVAALIFGLLAVGAAGLLTDKVVNPFRDALREARQK